MNTFRIQIPLLASCFFIGLTHQIMVLMFPLIAFQITAEKSSIAVFKMVEFIPNILLATSIGYLVDRSEASAVLRYSGIFMMSIIIAIAMSANLIPNMYLLLVLSFLFMTVNYTFNNARTVVTKAVFDGDQIININARIGIAMQILVLLGPFLAGWLSEDFRSVNLAIVLVICLIGVVTAHYVLKVGKSESIPVQPINFRELGKQSAKAFGHLRRNRLLWSLSWVAMLANMLETFVYLGWFYTSKTSLGLSNLMVGLVFSCYGLGGIVGGVLVDRIFGTDKSLSALMRLMIVSLLGMAGAAVLPFIFFTLPGLVASSIGFGMFSTVFSVNIWSTRQMLTPVQVMGQVSGATSAVFKLGMPIAAFTTIPLIANYSVNNIFLVVAIASVLLAIVVSFILKNRIGEVCVES